MKGLQARVWSPGWLWMQGLRARGCCVQEAVWWSFSGGQDTPCFHPADTEWARQALSGLIPARLAALWQGGPPALGGPPGTHTLTCPGAAQGVRQLPHGFSGLGSGNRCGKCCNVLPDKSDGLRPPAAVCWGLRRGLLGACWFTQAPWTSQKGGVPGGWPTVGWAGPGALCPLPAAAPLCGAWGWDTPPPVSLVSLSADDGLHCSVGRQECPLLRGERTG